MSDNEIFPVNELYETIQGEGTHAGTPSVFVRLQGCGVGCPWCFVPQTKILMSDGSHKRIDQVQVGDLVMSWNKDRFQPERVSRVYKSMARELLEVKTDKCGNWKTYVTPEHPYLVSGKGWVKAGDLRPGDVLVKWTVRDRMKSALNPSKQKAPRITVKMWRAASERMLKRWESPAYRKQQRLRMKNNNPMHDPEVAAKSYMSRELGGKTALEKKVQRVCAGLPIYYCGHGRNFSVAHKFPDFKVRGQNKIIEVWAADSLWALRAGRGPRWVKKRRALFTKHGYETLFLPLVSTDLRSDNAYKIRERVAQFVNNGMKVFSVRPVGRKAMARLYGSLSAPRVVYNLEVENTHTYVANLAVVHNCDTKHTWAVDPARRISLEEMLAKQADAPTYAEAIAEELAAVVASFQSRHVVLTGGEPCDYDLEPLVIALQCAGRTVQVETSGTAPARVTPLTWVTCSPKIGMPGGLSVLPAVVRRADEIKMPIGRLRDIETLVTLLEETGARVPVFLQPLSTSEKATLLCMEEARRRGWRVSLQLHKFHGLR